MKLLCTITNGLMDLQSKTAVARYCAKVKNGNSILTMKAPMKPASWEEHKYCRGVAIPQIAEYMGHPKHEYPLVYDYVKHAVWAKYYPGKIPPSFASDCTSTVEFEDFMTKLRSWAAEDLKFYVLEPNEPACEIFLGD